MSSFVIWALVAATVVFWGLKLGARGQAVPAHATIAAAAPARLSGADVARLLGAPAAPVTAAVAGEALPPADARFKLIGVVAGRTGQPSPGLALIEVDGKPPRAFAVGTVVDAAAGIHLLSVGHRRIELGPSDGPAQTTIELPGLPEPARGTLPAGQAGAVAPAPPAPRVAMPPPSPMPGQPAAAPSTPGLPPSLGRGRPGAQGSANTQ